MTVSNLNLSSYDHDFLRTWDKSVDHLKATLAVAQTLRDLHKQGISPKVFNTGIAVSIFRDKSTRTKYSYAAAANLLGLEIEDLDEKKSQITHGETIMETVNMLSFLTRTIGIRDDIFLGVGHQYMVEVASAADWGYKNSVLNQRPSVINLQCDEDHPTQSLSDMLHLVNYFGGIEKLRDKKLTMSWAYSPSYGKPMSVPQGVIALMTRFGMNVTLAYPKGYNLIPEIEAYAGREAKKSGGAFRIMNNMEEAFDGADIVYPKSWASYGVMKKRTELLKKKDDKELLALEKEALAQNAKYSSWTCTQHLMRRTKHGKALYMHCLPADISGVSCKQGEVEASVFDAFKKETYAQAGYKPFIIAAMILLTQFGEKTPEILSRIAKRKLPLVAV
ncbi:knotted carbamoyltransferase YgeW [Candidatus Gottesmanbacteria bacterium RIFCSPLOWO2_01_FULL_49_10]|uniref:Knotted carbamoyltransferase YgeW n=1 Tax=Candidatus Gottesmanbacteria bacterium RIFCSPLOWO2_01_FULL_49_10 TaxID=1798396 RepID=A0A1F6B1I3_9BACT|nr:MAG: knotted carbamoyltransferase YgeW [Candidatus Gottesmanbacteria bacterium RIFCSPLOWO2_01_FULL_49_10]